MATANNLTQYFNQGAIQGFSDLVAPLAAFSYAVNQDGATEGDHVRVPFVTCATGSVVFNAASGYSGNNGGVYGKDVQLSIHLYQPIELTDADMALLSPEVLTRLGNAAGQRLASDFISASFASVVSTANFSGTSAYSGSQYTASVAIADLDKKANDNKWPDGQRFIIAGTSLWNSFMNNTNFTNAYALGAASAVQDGKLPSIFGFQPYKTTVSLPNADAGFAANPNAIAVAMAYYAPGDASKGLVDASKLTDTKTGITIGYRAWYDANAGKTRKVLEVLGGATVADPTALIHIKT